MITTMVTIDESSAFDCVNPDILRRKLSKYGFGRKTTAWFEQYLSGQRQYIAIGDKSSPMETLERGVPQGSVLGPLLYTVYINELPELAMEDNCQEAVHKEVTNLFTRNCDKCGHIPCYVDDATLVVSSRTRNENQNKIVRSMSRITEFLNNNELVVNRSKTNILENMVWQKRARIGGEPPTLEAVNPAGEQITIEAQEYLRLLGANFGQNLGWKYHLEIGDKSLLPEVRKHWED